MKFKFLIIRYYYLSCKGGMQYIKIRLLILIKKLKQIHKKKQKKTKIWNKMIQSSTV